MKGFMNENSIHEIVYSPISYEHFTGEEIIPTFSCVEISYFYAEK